MGTLFPGFWTIRLDRDCTQFSTGSKCYSKITSEFWNVGRSLQLRRISEFCGLGCYIRVRNRIPDPLTVLLILISRLVIPDPVAVIPDPIYLVTTLILARQVQKSAVRINSDRLGSNKKNKNKIVSDHTKKNKISRRHLPFTRHFVFFSRTRGCVN